MAYRLTYWENGNNPETHYALREVRLKSIQEAYPLSLEHQRPINCTLITVDRTDNQSYMEKIIWEK